MKFWRQDEDLDAEIGHHLEASTRDRIARGIVPQMGRAFLAEEFQPGHDQVAIISHRVWHRFSGDTKTSPRRWGLSGKNRGLLTEPNNHPTKQLTPKRLGLQSAYLLCPY